MKTYNTSSSSLPQLEGQQFITDGGLETTLIFHHGIELPHFAAFDLYSRDGGQELLTSYYEDYIAIAKKRKLGFILESATWRCNPNWGYKLGYDPEGLTRINKLAIEQLKQLRTEHQNGQPFVISGCIGPAGDGYSPEHRMTIDEADVYHSPQVRTLAESGADMITALTMNYTAEAIGIVMAAKNIQIPVVISFTVETDGTLPSGETLRTAIEELDTTTENYVSYYMINCAHPEHFKAIFAEEENWHQRIRGIRANSSCKSHEELDNSDTLDVGDKTELLHGIREIQASLPWLNVLGGCCGTDHSHIDVLCAEQKVFPGASSQQHHLSDM